LVAWKKEYMKLDVGKGVDHMTRRSCIPTDFIKSDNDCSSVIHNIGTGAYIDSNKINLVISESKEVGVKYGSLFA